MRWLKFFKPQIIIYMLYIPLICLGQDDKDSYQELVTFVKEANFTKFNQLYLKMKLSNEQKKELLAFLRHGILFEIDYFKNQYLKLNLPIGPEWFMEKELKKALENMKQASIVMGAFTFLVTGCFYWHYHNREKAFHQEIATINLNRTTHYKMNNVGNIVPNYDGPTKYAQWRINIGVTLDSDFLRIMKCLLCFDVCMLILGIPRFICIKKVLSSYKRWQEMNAIKDLIVNPCSGLCNF